MGSPYNVATDLFAAGLFKGIADNTDVRAELQIEPYLPKVRWSHIDRFIKKPHLQAAFDIPEGTSGYDEDLLEAALAANQNWVLAAVTGSDAADITFSANGGIRLETDAAGTRQCTIVPNESAAVPVCWGTQTFGYAQEPYMRAVFRRDSADVNYIVGMGFSDAASLVASAGVDECLFYITVDTAGTGVTMTLSVAQNGDDATDETVVPAAVAAALFGASDTLEVEIFIDSNRRPSIFLNKEFAFRGSNQLGAVTDILPIFGINNGGSVASAVDLRLLEVSKDYV